MAAGLKLHTGGLSKEGGAAVQSEPGPTNKSSPGTGLEILATPPEAQSLIAGNRS